MIAAILTAYAALVSWFARSCATAPEGYEDERGFHYGKEPRT